MTAAATISLTLESGWGMPAVRALHRIDPALALAPLNQDDPHAFAWLMLTTTLLTTAIWLTVTLATQPETEATLQAFYDRVRPAALGWRRFAISSGCPIHRDFVLRDGWESSPQTLDARHHENEARHSVRSTESPSLAPTAHRQDPATTTEARHSVRSTESPSLAPTARPVDPSNDPTLRYNFFHWVLGFTLVYAMLFGVGDLLFGRITPGCGLLALSGSCLAVLFYSLNRRGWSVWR